MIDHTLLKPGAAREDLIRICAEAREHGFATVCVRPENVAFCARELEGSNVKPVSVVGFPTGTETTAAKAAAQVLIDAVSPAGRKPQARPARAASSARNKTSRPGI